MSERQCHLFFFVDVFFSFLLLSPFPTTSSLYRRSMPASMKESAQVSGSLTARAILTNQSGNNELKEPIDLQIEIDDESQTDDKGGATPHEFALFEEDKSHEIPSSTPTDVPALLLKNCSASASSPMNNERERPPNGCTDSDNCTPSTSKQYLVPQRSSQNEWCAVKDRASYSAQLHMSKGGKNLAGCCKEQDHMSMLVNAEHLLKSMNSQPDQNVTIIDAPVEGSVNCFGSFDKAALSRNQFQQQPAQSHVKGAHVSGINVNQAFSQASNNLPQLRQQVNAGVHTSPLDALEDFTKQNVHNQSDVVVNSSGKGRPLLAHPGATCHSEFDLNYEALKEAAAGHTPRRLPATAPVSVSIPPHGQSKLSSSILMAAGRQSTSMKNLAAPHEGTERLNSHAPPKRN